MRFLCFLLSFIAAITMAEQYAMVFGTADDWDNYSITSEPCRVWTDLVAGGIKPENIIMMAYTTDLTTPENPYPGMIFTDPAETTDGDWAKYGCFEHVDYTGEDINGMVFLAILSGDAKEVEELTGKKNPKVLNAGPEDTVFTYFMDHGGEDVIGVGGDGVSHSDLYGALMRAHEKQLYGKWVWFMEACYSGSMFLEFPADWNIFIMTSADAAHAADMSNCPPNDVVAGQALDTCLSGLWDNIFLDYMEAHPDCTIGEIVDAVHDEVAKESEQNVSHFGDMTFRELKLREFVGYPQKSRYSEKKTKTTIIPLPDVPAHLAKWRAIRGEESADEEYKKIVFAEAKKEIEVMRLGVKLLGEKNANKAVKNASIKYSVSCVRDLSTALVEKCGHSFPLPSSATNILRNICTGSSTPVVDFSEICM